MIMKNNFNSTNNRASSTATKLATKAATTVRESAVKKILEVIIFVDPIRLRLTPEGKQR